MHLTVLGAGAWGTALAISACHRAVRHVGQTGQSDVTGVTLWARSPAQAELLRTTRLNQRYLGDVPLPEALHITADWDEALAHATPDDLLVIGTPMAALAEMLTRVPPQAPVLWLCKGFEQGSGRLGHEIAQACRPGGRHGVLSGPSFATEVACGQPTALVAASLDAALAERAVQALHSDSLRVYTSTDPVGVEVGGAVKNVLAIATGIADGLGLGLNARAALITRGLSEMTRLGLALGARPDTFMGLSGLGDLVLTATGSLSRNRTVGLQLAEGRPLSDILAALGHVAEGVYSAATVAARAHRLGVTMPVTEAVVQVLQGQLGPRAAVQALMLREARAEH